MTINTRSMTTDDLRAIQSQVCKELEKRSTEEKENAWKNVVEAISYYIANFGQIAVYDFEQELFISDKYVNMKKAGEIKNYYI